MIGSREKLIKIIENKAMRSTDESLKAHLQSKLVKDGRYTAHEYLYFFADPSLLHNLNNDELLWFAEAIESYGTGILNVSDYFTDHEIKNNLLYRRSKDEELFVLHNAFKLAEDQYICVVSAKQLALMKRYGVMRAIPEAQRQSRKQYVTDGGTEILRLIETYPKKVNEIRDKILSDEYHYNAIRINLMNDGLHKYTFDKDNCRIILPSDGDIIILDGNNRSLADEKAYSDNPEREYLFENRYFPVLFTFYDIERAKDCVSQEWKVAPVNKKHRESMERNYANFIVDEIKRSNIAEDYYKRYIVTTGYEVNAGIGFIIHSVLANAIDEFYGVNRMELKSKAIEILNWLVTFFNYLTELMLDDFKRFAAIRKAKWNINPYAWVGYVYLSKQLYGVYNWKEQLGVLVEQIDWSIENSPIIYQRQVLNERAVKEFFRRAWQEYVQRETEN